jgi:hypothetical protein
MCSDETARKEMEAFKILGLVDFEKEEFQQGRPQQKIILKSDFHRFISEQCKSLWQTNTESNSVGKVPDESFPSKSDTVPFKRSPCYSCGSTKFWKTKDGTINCTICHPPVSEADVKERIEI